MWQENNCALVKADDVPLLAAISERERSGFCCVGTITGDGMCTVHTPHPPHPTPQTPHPTPKTQTKTNPNKPIQIKAPHQVHDAQDEP